VVLTLLIIFVTGMIVSNYLGGKLIELGDNFMGRIPLVRSIYMGVKQVTQTLFTPGGQSFRKVLLVEYPMPGTWTLAFQTGDVGQEIEGALGGISMVSCFVPTTPNPTSGFLILKQRSEVREVDISVDQALKYVISLGVVQPGFSIKNSKKIN